MFFSNILRAQVDQKDTVFVDDESVDEIIDYDAKDSIYYDAVNSRITLTNEAYLKYGDIVLKAGLIIMDLEKNEVTATYLIDSTGNKIGQPIFNDGIEEIKASSIRYNFDSKKGYIQDVLTQQDEMYLYMGIAKRQPNEEIHLKKGRITTCDLEEPHFHFQLSKAVLIPEKRIVSGPMNLWVKGVPTPLGLPFIILPQKKDRLTGFIFPQVVPSSTFGFGFQDLGYYWPINDRLQTTFYGTFYSRGSFGIKNTTDYSKRYNYKGQFTLGYERFSSGFPTNDSKTNFQVLWNHRKDPKSNPNWNFSSLVNFNTINTNQFNLDPTQQQYLNNSFNSDIRLDKSFGSLPLRAGLKMSTRQSTVTKNIELVSPVANLNMTQIYPLKNIMKSSRGWRQFFTRLGVTYDLEGKNASNFADTSLQQGRFNEIQDNFKNGISQNVRVKTTAGLLKNTVKLNPSLDYSNNYNFQTIEKYEDANSKVQSRLVSTPGMSQSLSLNASLTSVLYSYYKFIGKKKPLLRHVLTPTLGYSFRPGLNANKKLDVSFSDKPVVYSPFEQSTYRAITSSDASLITFGFNNTFELKRASDKDTVTGFKKTKLVDNLSLTGNYDLLKDSMNLSNLNLSLRVSPLRALNFIAMGSFSPYNWNDTTGATLKEYAIDERNELGRFLNTSFTTNITLTSRESRKKLASERENNENNWNSDYQYYLLYPERFVNFEIPWKLNLGHVYSINANQSISVVNQDRFRSVQTLNANGDLSFTKRWKLSGNTSFDFESGKVTYTQLNLIRDLHCWTLSFNWTPIAQVKFFSFQMNAKASMFQDAKLKLQKPPFFL